MTFVDLFAGIGGITLGLERAGHTCVGQVEIDEYATRVLEKHWPHVPRIRDVRDYHGHEFGPSTSSPAGTMPTILNRRGSSRHGPVRSRR